MSREVVIIHSLSNSVSSNPCKTCTDIFLDKMHVIKKDKVWKCSNFTHKIRVCILYCLRKTNLTVQKRMQLQVKRYNFEMNKKNRILLLEKTSIGVNPDQ